ncbi:MAG: pyridine nucleotide-disulfide oxidoreductase, partial [Marivirga sp.]|nr:pyridine nucleotide-disulfide oxidoreductase [Marivirga sp.]
QTTKIENHHIKIVETEIAKLEHTNGQLQKILFKDGTESILKVLYARSPFVQHCSIPETLRCEFTDEGYIKVDPLQKTSIHGIFACGDNTTRMRTVANAVAMGTTTGIMVNKEIVLEEF